MNKIILGAVIFILTMVSVRAQNTCGRMMKANSPAYTGDFYMSLIDRSDKSLVTKMEISPGGYNEWHIHPDAKQIMVIISGQGYYQEEGDEVRLLKQGDWVVTQPNVKHWNGSTPNDTVTIITITDVKDKPHVEWLGKIDAAVYSREKENPK